MQQVERALAQRWAPSWVAALVLASGGALEDRTTLASRRRAWQLG